MFFPGKLKTKEKVYSRCYLFFEAEPDMKHFISTFNKTFVDN
jgi:hypothetical protein